jgi:hypothetical protein
VKVLIVTLVLIVSFAADEQPVKPQEWQNSTVWHNIKTGQTPEQSVKLLGDPIETESSKAIEVWYYSDIPQPDENGKTVRPKHGFLMFRKTPTGNTLQKWMEPDWQTLPTWEQLQADYKQVLADQQAAKIAESKRLADEAAAERKSIAKEATEERQRNIDDQKNQQRVQIETPPKAASGNEESGTVEPKRNKPQTSNWFLDNFLIIGCSSGFVILLMVFVYKQ